MRITQGEEVAHMPQCSINFLCETSLPISSTPSYPQGLNIKHGSNRKLPKNNKEAFSNAVRKHIKSCPTIQMSHVCSYSTSMRCAEYMYIKSNTNRGAAWASALKHSSSTHFESGHGSVAKAVVKSGCIHRHSVWA